MKKIIFNDRYGLTKAVLEGRKTMTRRIVPQSVIEKYSLMEDFTIIDDARYNVGEVVAIAQSYKDAGYSPDKVFYRSFPSLDMYGKELVSEQKGWTNKMFVASSLMPHHIRITGVNVERLQDISNEDCLKEGIYPYFYDDKKQKIEYGFYPDVFSFDYISCHYPTPREVYAALIDSIYGKSTWDKNPFVFVYKFELSYKK